MALGGYYGQETHSKGFAPAAAELPVSVAMVFCSRALVEEFKELKESRFL